MGKRGDDGVMAYDPDLKNHLIIGSLPLAITPSSPFSPYPGSFVFPTTWA